MKPNASQPEPQSSQLPILQPTLAGLASPDLPKLLDAMSDAVVVVDRAGQIVATNRRFVETFGLAGHPLPGTPCPRAGNCLESGNGPETPCMVCDIAASREPRRALQVIHDASGQQRRWEATLNPVLGEKGEVQYIVEVWRDVTDRTKLEAQLSHNERLASL